MKTSTLEHLINAYTSEMLARESKGALSHRYMSQHGQRYLRSLRVMARLVRIQQEYNNRTK